MSFGFVRRPLQKKIPFSSVKFSVNYRRLGAYDFDKVRHNIQVQVRKLNFLTGKVFLEVTKEGKKSIFSLFLMIPPTTNVLGE